MAQSYWKIDKIIHNPTMHHSMCTYLFCMVHCGMWDRSIVGFVKLVYSFTSMCLMKTVCIKESWHTAFKSGRQFNNHNGSQINYRPILNKQYSFSWGMTIIPFNHQSSFNAMNQIKLNIICFKFSKLGDIYESISWIIIGAVNGLAPNWCQAITCTNGDFLLITATNLHEIFIQI